MADNAGIQLQVGLDLAYFRKEMQKVSNVASSEFTGQLNVKINRRALDRELNAVSALFRRRNYELSVNDTTIKTARVNVQKLTNSLNLLTAKTHEIRVAIKGVGGKTPAQQVDELQNIFGRGKTGEAFGAGSVATARAATARQGLLERLSKKSSSRGGYNIAGLEEVIRQLGGTPSGNRGALAKQAADLAKQVDDALIDRVWTSVKDLQMNMRYSGGAGYGVGQSISKMINSMSLVSSDPKNARNILRSLPPKYITTELAGRASEQSMANMALGQTSAPVGSKFQNSFDKYLNALLGQAMADASIARQRYLERTNPLNTLGGGTVPPRSYFRFGQGPQLPGSPILPALPPAGTTSNYGGRGGFVPPGGGGGGGGGGRGGALAFPGGGMGPSSQLGAGYYAVGQGLQSIKQAYAGVKPFLDTKKLPLSGAMAELGGEFGNAIKQVLLYGSAYKALAFFTSLPGQAFEAAKGLATYRNQLQAVTAESKTFDQSLAFVDNLARRFNVPLESARQGFVKLYASMQPAGFGQEQIEGLFTGISKAAAAFGLSADKVDRVNYAFAQMASKGQIMSEELKGQLGDVLPGALGLFAQAAQMSIPEFSKAMEDGAFKGKAMTQVLDNVAILMNTKFGPAAQGASKTLQGAVNQIQNNLKLMYESFTPVINTLAATFGPQVNSLIKDVTSTMQVLTGNFVKTGKGFEGLSPRAQSFYNTIKALEPAVKQAGAAILDLGNRFAALLPAIVNAVAAAITFASSPLGRGALLATAAIATLSGAFKLLEATGIKAAIKAVYTFIGSLLQIPAATGVARGAIIALKLAITGLVIGGVLIGLDFLIGKILNIGDAADRAKKDVKELAFNLNDLASAGDMIGLGKKRVEAENQVIIAERLLQTYQKLERGVKLSAQEREFLKEFGTRNPLESGVAYAERELGAALERRGMAQKALNAAEAAQQRDKVQREKELQKIDLSGSEESAAAKKQSLESYYSLQDQLAKAQTQADIDRIQSEFDHKFKLINSYYDLQEARANSFQKITIAFQKELLLIEQRRQDSMLKAQLEVRKAQGAVAGGAGGGGAGGAYLQGDIGPTSTGPHFDVKKMGGGYFPRNYLDQYVQVNGRPLSTGTTVPGGTFGAHQRRGSHGWDYAFGEGRYAATLTGGAEWMGGVPTAHGEARRFRIPTGEEFQFLHGRSEGIGAGSPRKVPGSEKRDLIAEQAASNAQIAQSTINLRANEMAAKETEIAFANYVAAIAPTAEQELQNQLLQKRIELMSSGVTGDFLETQIKIFEAEEKTRIAGELLDKNNKSQVAGYEALKAALPGYIAALKTATVAQQNLNFETAKSELNQRLAMAGALTPDAELKVGLAQKYPGDVAKQTQEFDLTKRVMAMEKAKEDLRNIASSISGAFGEAFKGIITGSVTAREALANMFQSIADSFADMVAQMITEWIKMMVLKGIEAIINPLAGLSNLGGSLGGGLSSGFSAGVASAVPTDAAGWGASFGTSLQFANGGIATGGFRAFANGGVVTGPTLGLVGEGRYNEAVIPLPDGKSVPVELGGAMGGQAVNNIVVNVDAKGSKVEGDEQESKQLGRVIAAAIQQELVKQKRPGGLLT